MSCSSPPRSPPPTLSCLFQLKSSFPGRPQRLRSQSHRSPMRAGGHCFLDYPRSFRGREDLAASLPESLTSHSGSDCCLLYKAWLFHHPHLPLTAAANSGLHGLVRGAVPCPVQGTRGSGLHSKVGIIEKGSKGLILSVLGRGT